MSEKLNKPLNHIMFIHGSLRMGGVETFLVRVSRAFNARGISVTVLLMSHQADATLLASLKEVARVIYMDDICAPRFMYREQATLLNYYLPIDKTVAHDLVAELDHIHFTDCMTMVVALEICRRAALAKKISGGVYHQHEYSFAGIQSAGFTKRLHYLLKEVVTVDNLVFYNEISKLTVSKMVEADCSASTLLPIGIDLLRFKPRNFERLNRCKVVSVGRITRFKTYNFTFLETLLELKRLGHRLEYHIYGEGECLAELREKIDSLDLSGQVRLHGNLNYAQFQEVLEDALLFLGSGTALIEAAACGVPALIGIESETKPISYGFLHDTSGLSYHEAGLDYPLRTFTSFCQALLESDQASYRQTCEMSLARAQDFSMERFIEGFMNFHASLSTPDYPAQVIERFSFIASLIIDKLLKRGSEGSYWTRHNLGQPEKL